MEVSCSLVQAGCKAARHAGLLLAGLMLAASAMAAVPGADSTEPAGGMLPPAQAAGNASEPAPAIRAPKKSVRYVWRINDGDKISDAFRAWARQARQWQVSWEAPELVAQASVDLDGSFEDAVGKVIEALNRGDANLLARFYVEGNSRALRVLEKK